MTKHAHPPLPLRVVCACPVHPRIARIVGGLRRLPVTATIPLSSTSVTSAPAGERAGHTG